MNPVFLLSVLALPLGVLGVVPPMYDDLINGLPITVEPHGSTQFLFFIVPVQKRDDMDVLVQMTQIQDKSQHIDASLVSTGVHAHDGIVETIDEENHELLEDMSGLESGDFGFNFQVPVVVPMDFQFRYDASTASESLPQCVHDSRTWRENVISKIARTLELKGKYDWDHSDLNIKLRLIKDLLSATLPDDLVDIDSVKSLMESIITCKTLSDMKTAFILQDVVELTANHISIVAEGLDTYILLQSSLAMVSDALSPLTTTEPVEANAVNMQIDTVLPQVQNAIDIFQAAFDKVNGLNDDEE